jgi:hypothetical protein
MKRKDNTKKRTLKDLTRDELQKIYDDIPRRIEEQLNIMNDQYYPTNSKKHKETYAEAEICIEYLHAYKKAVAKELGIKENRAKSFYNSFLPEHMKNGDYIGDYIVITSAVVEPDDEFLDHGHIETRVFKSNDIDSYNNPCMLVHSYRVPNAKKEHKRAVEIIKNRISKDGVANV